MFIIFCISVSVEKSKFEISKHYYYFFFLSYRGFLQPEQA